MVAIQHGTVSKSKSWPVSVALVSLILWVLPRPHRPLEYMIAGTAGTIVWLALVLAILLRSSRPAIRIVRRSKRPS
jgi:hypothetical protein